MSQWVTKRQEVLKDVNETTLERALADMGFHLDARKIIENSWGSDDVDRGLTQGTKQLPLGFSFVEEEGKKRAELKGDFFMTGLRENTFINEVAQQYQKHNISDQLQNQGWNIDNVSMNEEEEIVIDAYQWA